MKRSIISRILLSAAFLSLTGAVFGQTSAASADVAASFSRFELTRATIADTGNGSRQIKFSGDRAITVELTPHDLRIAGSRSENTGIDGRVPQPLAAISTYTGTGVGGVSARINFNGGVFEGFLNVNGEILFIEPASRYSKSSNAAEYVIYRQKTRSPAVRYRAGQNSATRSAL
ncbi:MAG TPA: hypothetical protein PK108_01435 [Pyrinomonadaceae bacterium]|nr:hypothetical protein [Pyrinomonadaceae bacterium]